MDSGWAVPTLKVGLSETVAEKLLTVARVRCGETDWAALAESWCDVIPGAGPAEFMLLRNARFFAALRLGRRSAASTARMTMTTNSSIRVNAREGILISHLMGSLSEKICSIAAAKGKYPVFSIQYSVFSGRRLGRVEKATGDWRCPRR